MDKQQLEAIRVRDADYNDIFEQQAQMSPHIAHRLVAWPVADRRALLAAYDALAAAARAVVDRWDTPLWKDAEPTAGLINRLRRVLEGER